MVAIDEVQQVRAVLLKYTREAFLKLPHIDKPRILDVGCGSGGPAIELSKLTDGAIVGIDTDAQCIEEFKERIKHEALSSRVMAVNRSLSEMHFPDGSFDVVWSEGKLDGLTFEDELREWRRLLKQSGYLVIHYETKDVKDSIPLIPNLGYALIDIVALPRAVWWTEFYEPLQEKMGYLLEKYSGNPKALKYLEQLGDEVEMVKRNPCDFSTAFYIMKKT
jgi:ubiquinone/menaquinone biosynthesis C-methylase UbiE